VRVYQQFATLDLLSGGRAEIMAGRGSFIESFPLFGYDLNDYDALFEEKLALLLAINASARVSWPGSAHTQRIDNLGVHPRAERELPIWIAVGGTPQSVARAGAYGLPLALAIIGGMPERFAPLVELYREAARRSGVDAERLKVGINSHGFVGDTREDAAEAFFPTYQATMTRIGRERGWPTTTRAQFDAGTELRGHLVVGSPEELIEKILYQHKFFRHDRFLIQMSLGPTPRDKLLRAIELLGTKVAPAVRRETAGVKQAVK
jgi:alkanesulfonate monooxygenase SsuD/methylene tetrahydromethanopterin reductase-like flavin-dependent oxidoreductase (luciferase family)